MIWLGSDFNFIKNLDFWGYYGAFIIGKENLVQDLDFVTIVKKKILLDNLKLLFQTVFFSYQNYQQLFHQHEVYQVKMYFLFE